MTAEIATALAGTGLAGAEILPVSAVTGEGIDALRERLDGLRRATATARGGRPLPPRGRSLASRWPAPARWSPAPCLSGRVAVGDAVVVSPSGLEARVRSLHAQNRAGRAGRRRRALRPGPGGRRHHQGGDRAAATWCSIRRCTRRPTASTRGCACCRSEAKPIGQWMPVRLPPWRRPTWRRAWSCCASEPIAPGETELVQLVLDRPIAAAAGDRFVIRDTSASRTIGGGVLIDLRAPARKRRTPERRARAAGARCRRSRLRRCRAPSTGRAALSISTPSSATAPPPPSRRATPSNGPISSCWPAAGRSIALRPRDLAAIQRRGPSRRSTPSTPNGPICRASDRSGCGCRSSRACRRRCSRRRCSSLAAAGAVVARSRLGAPAAHEVRMTPEEERIWSRAQPLLGARQPLPPAAGARHRA